MDIGNLVDTEQLFTLELKSPLDDTLLGITLQIRSESSKAAKDIIRTHSDQNMERVQRRKVVKSATTERQEIERVAAYIASWDWQEHTWHGGIPEFNSKKVMQILEKEDWIVDQVTEAAIKISNFTPISVRNSLTPSE